MSKYEMMKVDEMKEMARVLKVEWKDEEAELMLACLDDDEAYILKCAKRVRNAWEMYSDISEKLYKEYGIAI